MKIKSKLIYQWISALLLAAVVVTVFVLSSQNSVESTETSGFFISLISRILKVEPSPELVRTLAHFCEFAVLGFLALNCIYAFTQRKPYILSVALSWGYALTDEIHQIFVPGRAFQISDLLVDLGGIVVGCGVIYFILGLYEKRSS